MLIFDIVMIIQPYHDQIPLICLFFIHYNWNVFFKHGFHCYIINIIEISWLEMLNVSYIDTAKGMWFEHVNVNDLPFQAKKTTTNQEKNIHTNMTNQYCIIMYHLSKHMTGSSLVHWGILRLNQSKFDNSNTGFCLPGPFLPSAAQKLSFPLGFTVGHSASEI